MGTGYTRNDVSNNIATGNIISASDIDGEYDAIEAAFNSSTGHTHDGTSAEGGPITVVGPVQDLVVSATEVKPKTTNTLDLGTSALLYKDAYLQGNMYFRDTALKIVSSADGQLDIDADVEVEITAPTLDIDASTAVTIDTATLTITGSANVTGDLDVDNININGNTIISTNTNGNIALTPNGTGEVDISKVDIDSGAIDGTTIGASSAAAITGTTITGTSFVSSGDMTFGDNDKAVFGAGSDLQIYHSGTNSFIYENGTGYLSLFGNGTDIRMQATGNENMLIANVNGSVDLYHDNSKKFATTATGIDVTGTVTADGLTVDNSVSTFNGTTVNIDLMESDTTDANTRIRQSASGLSIQTVNDAATAATNRMRIDHTTGDISFRADDGTTDALYFDASTQRLGLGTTSPATALHINEDSANQIRLQRSGYDTIDIALSENGLRFRNETDGRNDLFLDGAGNVGIGTSNPTQILTVAASGTAARISITDTDTVATAMTGLLEFDGSDTRAGFIGYNGGNLELRTDDVDNIIFSTNATEAARIDSSGNLLVGTTNADPVTANVAGFVVDAGDDIKVSNNGVSGRFNRISSNGDILEFYKDGSEVGAIGVADTSFMYIGGSGSTKSGLYFNDSDRINPVSNGSRVDATTDLGQSNYRFKDLYLSGTLTNDGTGGISIDTSGNVGIGTSSLTKKLEVIDDSSQKDTLDMTYQIAAGMSSTSTPAAGAGGGIGFEGPYNGTINTVYGVISGEKEDATSGNSKGVLRFGVRRNNPAANMEAMRIDSDGNLLVGKTAEGVGNIGFQARPDGFFSGTRNGGTVAYLQRQTSDGEILRFQKDSSTVGSIGVNSSDNLYFSTANTGFKIADDELAIIPANSDGTNSDNDTDLGMSAVRFDDIFATNGTIQTSDQNEKNTITDSDLGLDFINRLAPKSYVFNGKTRTHYGLIAQDVETVLGDISKPTSGFAGFIKSDISEEQDGSEYRYGLRYTEFVGPLIKALQEADAKIEALEARIAALEGA